jgi:hypothetical protein
MSSHCYVNAPKNISFNNSACHEYFDSCTKFIQGTKKESQDQTETSTSVVVIHENS